MRRNDPRFTLVIGLTWIAAFTLLAYALNKLLPA